MHIATQQGTFDSRVCPWLPPISQCGPTLLFPNTTLLLLWYPNPRRTQAQTGQDDHQNSRQATCPQTFFTQYQPSLLPNAPLLPFTISQLSTLEEDPRLDQRPHNSPELQPPTWVEPPCSSRGNPSHQKSSLSPTVASLVPLLSAMKQSHTERLMPPNPWKQFGDL